MPIPSQTGSPKIGLTEWNDMVTLLNGTETAAAAAVSIARLPAGSTLTVYKSGGTWPARPTARTDITVQWVGVEPSPAIVASGTGGMLDNVDIRLVTS